MDREKKKKKKQNEREVRQQQHSEARHIKDKEERCRKKPTALKRHS